MHKRTSLFAGVVLLLALVMLAGPAAQAQDDEYTFKGFYVGANFGGAWGDATTGFTPLPDEASFFDLQTTALNPEPTGWVAGGQAGYNWQNEAIVFGLEADFQGTGLDGLLIQQPIIDSTGTAAFCAPGCFLRTETGVNWFGTVRARVGVVAAQRVLFYGTGGLAYGKVEWAGVTDYIAGGGCCRYVAVRLDDMRTGWTAGGGIEFLIHKHWTLRGEYLHIDLGDQRVVANPIPANPPFQVQYDHTFSANVFRGAINFRF